MADPDNPRFAHFESVKETSLYDLYSRHAEVARDIHQDALRRFTGNNGLTVELVRDSPIIPESPEKTIDNLQQYEVVSVSSGVGLGAILSSSGVSSSEVIQQYRTTFAEEDMPVYIVAAGNEGLTKYINIPRVADFARNSLVVGEANLNEGGPLVEEHSSRVNPSLTADSPFNRGERYQFYNTSPSLEGHEELIRNWVIQNEINIGYDLFKAHNTEADEDLLAEAYRNIRHAKFRQYNETEEGRAWVQGQVDGYMQNPETLHTQIMDHFREGRIREWVVDNRVREGFEAFKNFNQKANLSDEDLAEAYRGISNAQHRRLTETPEGRAWVDEQVDRYMANPELLGEHRQECDIDENGFVTGLDGTSFSAPEQAGHISGAIYEQTLREADNLPILTKDEITTLAKMATIDTTAREGTDDPMHSYTNPEGHEFINGGGHGIFQPEMFRALVDEAYKRIETNPEINRDSITAVLQADLDENHNGAQSIKLESNLPEGTNMVIDRVRFDIDYDVDGTLPHFVNLKPNGEEFGITRLQEASSQSHVTAWARMENFFGETHSSGSGWEVELVNGGDAVVKDARITMFGYAEGGLMDQMMDYSKELAAGIKPEPEINPATAPIIDGTSGQESPADTPTPQGGMR